MDIIDVARSRIPGLRPTDIYECRDCGAKVDEDTTECPTCESTEIAHYELE